MSLWSRESCRPRATESRPPPSTNCLRRRHGRRCLLLPLAAPTRNELAGLPAYARRRSRGRVACAPARAGSFLEAKSGASGVVGQNCLGIPARFEVSVVPLESSAQRRNRRRLRQQRWWRRRRGTKKHREPAHLLVLPLSRQGRRRSSLGNHCLAAPLYLSRWQR